MFVEIRRCIYGHELEGYKHANEHGDLEMVGGSHEEREGILGSYGASCMIIRWPQGSGPALAMHKCRLCAAQLTAAPALDQPTT